MRIMLDTNVLVSALLFPTQKMNTLMEKVTTNHQLVLSSYIVDEQFDVTHRKFPDKIVTVDTLLSQLSYELIYTPKQLIPDLFEMRDAKDYPILYSAITEDVDVFVTGDDDFSEVEIENPEILTPTEFLNKY